MFGIAIGGTTLLASVTYGWWLVVLPVLGALTMGGALRMHPRSARPELVGALSFALLELNIACSVLVSGGGSSPLLPLLVVPVFSQAVCFRPQVTRVWVALSALAAVGAVTLAPLLPPVPAPSVLLQIVGYLALLSCLALAAQYLATADVNSRHDGVVDPLTGLLNRRALERHFAEARASAVRTFKGVAVVVCDIDRFKAVNDTLGHAHGDLVLQDVASRLVGAIRETDVVYRIGGEEFLVLLPGQGVEAAMTTAERLRAAVAASPVAGLTVTISAGVAGAYGGGVDLGRLTAEADRALYQAKNAGRNCVRSTDHAS
ncbi:GGDEF domain-containing protein [Actinotalea sp. K2]|uniref:GGDEF domain-containing protein n=1 Tax=Actinotalea sp. K2 TaxID=2939438 RepID=UPI0020174B9E|nr:GGDEF domain-containing protein [Actinotalea sp. K2]